MGKLKITIEGDSGTGKGLLANELKENLEKGAWNVNKTVNKDSSVIIIDAEIKPVPKTHPNHQRARKCLIDYILTRRYLSYIEIIQFRLNNDVNNDFSKVREAIKIVFPEHINSLYTKYDDCNVRKLLELMDMELPTNDARMKLHDDFWISEVYRAIYEYDKNQKPAGE